MMLDQLRSLFGVGKRFLKRSISPPAVWNGEWEPVVKVAVKLPSGGTKLVWLSVAEDIPLSETILSALELCPEGSEIESWSVEP